MISWISGWCPLWNLNFTRHPCRLVAQSVGFQDKRMNVSINLLGEMLQGAGICAQVTLTASVMASYAPSRSDLQGPRSSLLGSWPTSQGAVPTCRPFLGAPKWASSSQTVCLNWKVLSGITSTKLSPGLAVYSRSYFQICIWVCDRINFLFL